MFNRRFTLAEAEALLPDLRKLLAALTEHKQTVDELQRLVGAVTEKAGSNGHMHGNYEVIERQAEEAAEAANAIVRRIADLGCQVKDMDAGLVDFPADYRGHTILLCWRLGEEHIGWWHEVDSGFAGRQPVPGDIS